MRAFLPSLAGGLALVASLAGCDQRSARDAAPIIVRATFGRTGLSPGQFVYPRAIDAGAESIWVIDKTARVQRLDMKGERAPVGFAMPESALGKPTGVTIAAGPDGQEALYVPDTHYHRILIYDPELVRGEDPRLIASFGEFGEGPGQFIYPTDVCVVVGSAGLPERIYVSEYGGNDRVSVFDAEYRFLFAFGTQGTSEGATFDRPQSIEYEPSLGELIVTDACNHRVGRFTLDGELVAWIGSPDSAGDAPGAFAYPYGLDLPGNGTAVVSEFGNGRVQHIDLETGESLGVYGVPGRGAGELMSPWGVVIVGDTVYVLDSGSDRVVSFDAPRRARQVAAP